MNKEQFKQHIKNRWHLFVKLLKSKLLYLSIVILTAGIYLNLLSQEYLHLYVSEGKDLPVLSDLILENIPYHDVDYLYDIFSVVSMVIFSIYIIHYSRFHELPYFLILIGAFQTVRAVFIVLTPFGNPPMFDGTDSVFEGFSNYEIGVYPSGHTGVAYLYFIMARNLNYRLVLFLSFLVIVAALFLSRGHYSIDILSGVFFAYAIKAFGDKHFKSMLIAK